MESNSQEVEAAPETTESVESAQVTGEQNNIDAAAEAEGAPVVSPNTLLDEDVSEEKKIDSPQSSEEKPESWPEDLWDKNKGGPKYDETLQRLQTAEKRVEDLRKKLSTKGDDKDAPEEYKFEGLPEGIDSKDPSMALFSSAAKEAGLSNEQANTVLSQYLNASMKNVDESRKAEVEKLGPDGSQMLSSLSQFGQARVNNKTFSDQELGIYKEMINSAGAARVMSKIVEMTGEKPLPTSVRALSDIPSVEDVKSSMVEALKISDRGQREKAMRDARRQLERLER